LYIIFSLSRLTLPTQNKTASLDYFLIVILTIRSFNNKCLSGNGQILLLYILFFKKAFYVKCVTLIRANNFYGFKYANFTIPQGVKNVRVDFSKIGGYLNINSISFYKQVGFTYKKLGLLKLKTNFLFNNLTPFKHVSINKESLVVPKYNSSTISVQLPMLFLKNIDFFYLRKNKVYNKGRYSRCRQNYRTGVYMCMYLSIVSIFGLYYWFYKFSFNFTYLWWLFIAFVGSFFIPKIIKYRLYEPNTLISFVFNTAKWCCLFVKSFF